MERKMNLCECLWLVQMLVQLASIEGAPEPQTRRGRSEDGLEWRRGEGTPVGPWETRRGRWGRGVESKWSRKHLSYRVSTYSSHNLSRQFVDTELAQAFLLWQQATDLTFRKSNDFDVDLEMRFVQGEHGDALPFLDHTLAHAFLPVPGEPLAGSIHFNDAYMHWQDGTTLRHTAAHEIGHALGLTHSSLPQAIMSPYQGNARLPVLLHPEDMERIQKLYGPPRVPFLNEKTNGIGVRWKGALKGAEMEGWMEGRRRTESGGKPESEPEPPSSSQSSAEELGDGQEPEEEGSEGIFLEEEEERVSRCSGPVCAMWSLSGRSPSTLSPHVQPRQI